MFHRDKARLALRAGSCTRFGRCSVQPAGSIAWARFVLQAGKEDFHIIFPLGNIIAEKNPDYFVIGEIQAISYQENFVLLEGRPPVKSRIHSLFRDAYLCCEGGYRHPAPDCCCTQFVFHALSSFVSSHKVSYPILIIACKIKNVNPLGNFFG